MRSSAFLFLSVLPVATAAAQTSGAGSSDAARRAAATITEADYRRRIEIIAHDSMGGRGTPSRGLELTAQYIADEFRRFGLRGGGDNGTFFQRYPIRWYAIDSARTSVAVQGAGLNALYRAGVEARFLGVQGGPIPAQPVTGPLVLVAGPPADTARPYGDIDVRGAIILAITRGNQAAGLAYLTKAVAGGARGWITISITGGEQFATGARQALRPPQPQLGLDMGGTGGVVAFQLRNEAAGEIFGAVGLNFDSLRAAAAPAVQRALPLTVTLSVKRDVVREETAPNTIGVLEGSDPALRGEYVVFTAHMDHVGMAGAGNGCGARGGDSICNGADDDASGTTGIVELAEAYSQMNPRPRRSLVFMTVSGEERGLWGSEYYSERPTLPLAQTVANINLDMIGRYFNDQPGWRDTISVIGKEHSDLGPLADRITREHPELRMNLVDDMWPNENFYYRSDHYHFARKGVPILFFFNGTHPDYHRPSDHVDKIDAEKASRIVQMVYYLGLEIANQTARPQWNPESRARIVERPTS